MITCSTRASAAATTAALARRVVRLDVDHRPYRDAECAQRVLEPAELRQQQRVHAGARLVRRPHVVAERFDDVIGRDAEMGRAVLQHREHRLDDAAGRADLDAVAVEMSRPRRVVLAEDLIRPVDEMNDHRREPVTADVSRAPPRQLRSGQVGSVRTNIASHAAVSQVAYRWSDQPRCSTRRCHSAPSMVA